MFASLLELKFDGVRGANQLHLNEKDGPNNPWKKHPE